MNKKVHDAMDYISDAFLADAAAPKKRPRYRWLGAVAAVLAVVLVCAAVLSALKPQNADDPTYPYINYGLVAAPVYLSSGGQSNIYTEDAKDALSRLADAILSSTAGENAVCSPLNTYMALSMLAEISGGSSRQQILAALNQSDPTALRSFANGLWQNHYKNGVYKSILANSLWLSDGGSFNRETADLLAQKYFASVYRGDLSSSNMQMAYRDWLNKETGGLLKNQASNIQIPPQTVLLLASTIYYQANWDEKFHDKANSQRIFHTENGPVTATFMNDVIFGADYYVGKDCRAVRLALEDGSFMWLTLPNEGVDPLSVAHFYREPGDIQPVQLTLSVPKFDISAKTDLKGALEQLGITDIFSANADFSPITSDQTLPLRGVEHTARVAIDERGVIGAAYTSITVPGAAKPPEYPQAELIFDRPFTFSIISSYGIPLFTGIVGNPTA